jgi:hypothetical protein
VGGLVPQKVYLITTTGNGDFTKGFDSKYTELCGAGRRASRGNTSLPSLHLAASSGIGEVAKSYIGTARGQVCHPRHPYM